MHSSTGFLSRSHQGDGKRISGEGAFRRQSAAGRRAGQGRAGQLLEVVVLAGAWSCQAMLGTLPQPHIPPHPGPTAPHTRPWAVPPRAPRSRSSAGLGTLRCAGGFTSPICFPATSAIWLFPSLEAFFLMTFLDWVQSPRRMQRPGFCCRLRATGAHRLLSAPLPGQRPWLPFARARRWFLSASFCPSLLSA